MAEPHPVRVTGQDFFKDGAKDTAQLIGPVAHTRRAQVPLLRVRLATYFAAFLLAAGTLVAQAILVTHKFRGTVLYVYYFGYYYGYTTDTVTFKGDEYAKEPKLVLAVAAIACLVAIVCSISLLFPVVSASLAGAIVEVAIVPLVLLLWIAAVGVSAKTAHVLRGSRWPKAWKRSNAAALGFESASVLVWLAALMLGIISLVRVVKARKAARAAARASDGVDAA